MTGRHTTSTSRFPARRDGIYYLNGEEYVSTTDVLSVLAKPALVRWAAKQAAKAILSDPMTYDTAEAAANAVDKIKADAAVRGRALHDVVEQWATAGGTLPANLDRTNGYVAGFEMFIRAWNPKPLFTECVVFNTTHKYAGRLDLIAQVGGEIWLIDFKTASAVWPEYGIQLVAYKNAEFMKAHDDSIHPMPPVDKTGIVLVPGNGLFDFKPTNEPFEVFLALKTVHAWSKHKAA